MYTSSNWFWNDSYGFSMVVPHYPAQVTVMTPQNNDQIYLHYSDAMSSEEM